MSGDVQPRKRKDKKRKKDESAEQIPPQLQTHSSNVNEDVNIHVHKEGGTGGGICAKIVFFFLFLALALVIGLIITEHRGLTDLDTVGTESRFSQLFEGWIDSSHSHDHDDEVDQVIDSIENDEHDEEVDEHDNEIEEEPEPDEQDDSDENDSEVEESDEPEDDDESELVEEDDESEDIAEQDQDELEDDNDIDEDDDDDEEVDDVEEISKEASEEGDELSKEVEPEEEADEVEEDNIIEEQNEENEEEVEKVKEIIEEAENQENSRMVVKIGVGVALLVVAHVVLVKKWKSASPPTPPTPNKNESLPDLKRRNTIVVPPTYQEVQQDIEETVEEDYSDEDGEVDSDIEDNKRGLKKVKTKYQELRSTYTRSLTPDSEPEYHDKRTDEEEYEDEEIGDEEEIEEESDIADSDREDYDDEELIERLEAKYGKLGKRKGKVEDIDEQFSTWKRINVRDDNEPEESDSDRQSDVDVYEYENITNKDDWKIKDKIDEVQGTIQNNAAYATKLFDALLQNYPSSPRVLYGKALSLDTLAEQKRSNELLQQAILNYLKLLDLDDVPDALIELAAERCINRMRFAGSYNRAISVHNKLIARFPEKPRYRNQLVVTYLTMNQVNKARTVLQETLRAYPNDGFALVHYGFILKTTDNKLDESIIYMKKGIDSKEPGVVDGRFYFHLGDALTRVGRKEEAMKLYEEGVQQKLFLSKYQRSLYNVEHLKGQAWWKKEETPYHELYRALENNWEIIRNEGLSVLSKKSLFQNESENLRNTGDWKQFELFARGRKQIENCKKCPVTCGIVESIPDARGCKRGQTKFSVMHPGTHVWPHCGPTNCRLRVHLGLNVPPHTYIRVADEIRSWENGKVFIFDDSFEHEVWHNGTTFRLVLIVDVWHPELTRAEKNSLSPI